jgi:hypothetical protein
MPPPAGHPPRARLSPQIFDQPDPKGDSAELLFSQSNDQSPIGIRTAEHLWARTRVGILSIMSSTWTFPR